DKRDVDILMGNSGLHISNRCRIFQIGQNTDPFSADIFEPCNEAEARDTLDALQNMFDVEPDVGALLYGEER
ncbi:hydrogenase assembly chaperone, partial [Salmonella enterica subsp. enterica serovar Kentucky]|nr:hydrogenase assembly chaperone [Salmonella enterica subsp. enterica serovar Kentucky]